MEYGVFIKIPGCRKQGCPRPCLLALSLCLSLRSGPQNPHVVLSSGEPREIVDVGEKVWVKVIGKEMQDEKVKLSLSMKAVNQGTGKDLDPNNVILEQDERKRRSSGLLQAENHSGGRAQHCLQEVRLQRVAHLVKARRMVCKEAKLLIVLQRTLLPEEMCQCSVAGCPCPVSSTVIQCCVAGCPCPVSSTVIQCCVAGCSLPCLVHRTHMSSCRVENPAEIVDVGEKVWVKVIGKEMQDEKVKLSLSMKAVNQGTGKDLDPNNVILEQDERKRREFGITPSRESLWRPCSTLSARSAAAKVCVIP
ncbi:nucleolar protein of 40 kDa-like isoform X1, partial [Acipenser oxyrinchus oxyrinchus]